jgi:hypothetical protein
VGIYTMYAYVHMHTLYTTTYVSVTESVEERGIIGIFFVGFGRRAVLPLHGRQ